MSRGWQNFPLLPVILIRQALQPALKQAANARQAQSLGLGPTTYQA